MKYIFSFILLIAIQNSLNCQNNWNVFECNKDCNSDLIFKIKYPTDWVAENPDHYGILKKFRPKDTKGIFYMISINKQQDKMSDNEIKNFLSIDTQRKNLDLNLKKYSSKYLILNIKSIVLEGNAIVTDYITESTRATGIETRICRSYQMIYENYLVSMNATINAGGSFDECKKELQNKLNNFSSVFDKIAGSFIIKKQ